MVLILFVCCWLMLPESGSCNKPPEFTHVDSYLTLPEDLAPGSNVTSLSASDDDDMTLYFSIIGLPPKVSLQIKPLGPKSALVFLASAIDRETIDQFTVTFQVTDRINPPISQQCLVIITDVNDNPPKLKNLPNGVDLPENSPNRTLVFTVVATDQDMGLWGTVTFELLNELNVFEINPATGDVLLIGKLVYVMKRLYVLHVMVVDGGGLNSTADLTINVLDSQSRPPYFIHLPYDVKVFENTSIGTTVIQVSAYDGVTGLPGQAVYSIVSGDLGFFTINASSGWITVHTIINCSNPAVIQRNGLLEMTVKASSNSTLTNDEVVSYALVTVRLIDVNNQKPTFNQKTYNTTILKNSPSNLLLTFDSEIIIYDWDLGDNGKYRIYLLQNGHPLEGFSVIPVTGQYETPVLLYVTNLSPFTVGKTNIIEFQIVAQEFLSVENYSSSADIMVSIDDQNGRFPVFSQAEYVVRIPENPRRGQFIVRVTATEQNSNNVITYSLLGSKAFMFLMNSSTGDVFVNVDADSNHTLLNRETDPVVSLMIEAVNNEALQSFALLTILLEDINDNAPVMTSSIYYASLQENAVLFLFPVVVEATDVDMVNRIIYSVVGGNYSLNFPINQTSGLVAVFTPIDYETLPYDIHGKINLTVMAANDNKPTLNSTATLVIIVQDMNDIAPKFLQQNYQAVILENATKGSAVLNVTAVDLDATSPNNLVSYSMVFGSRDNFVIDFRSGLISVATGADFDPGIFPAQYVLTVRATDGGAPPLTGDCTVNITILSVNDKPPLFLGGKQFLSVVKDDAYVGTEVRQLSASVPDPMARLQYQFLNSTVHGFNGKGDEVGDRSYLLGLFAVNADTGVVTVQSILDAGTVEVFNISVMVAQTSDSLNDTASLTVFIKRSGNSLPQFLPPKMPLAVHVPEASPPGAVVSRLVAVDPYEITTPMSYFIIYNSDISRRFEISDANRLTGLITVKSSLYTTEPLNVSLQVVAAKFGQFTSNSSTTLVVLIDPNSSELRWDVFPSMVSILENSTVGTYVTKVSAAFIMTQKLIPIMYFIVIDIMEKFTISNSTGVIVTAGPMNARIMSGYRLSIEAVAGGDRIVGDITIRVLGANGNGPRFEQQLYTAFALSNATVGTPLVTVRAVDDDYGSLITYSIDRNSGNGSWQFGVDPISGSVFVSNSLLSSTGNLYFVVIADDRGSPPLLGSAVVRVSVIDMNGNRLRITSPPDNVTLFVQQNQPPGLFVALVMSAYIGNGVSSSVNYFLMTAFVTSDWKYFTINKQTGIITTTEVLAASTIYYLQVQAADESNTLYTDYRNLTIAVLDSSFNTPTFDRGKYPPPVKASILEGINNVVVMNVNIAERPRDSNRAICYFLVGGTGGWNSRFSLDRLSGDLWLVISLYRSQTSYMDLVVKVSEDCWSGFWEMDRNLHAAWNESDTSLLLVRVFVFGSGSVLPQFLKNWFFAGIVPDVELGEPVLNMVDYTDHIGQGNDSLVFYALSDGFRVSTEVRASINGLNRPPFVVGQTDGIVRTNSYFQSDWIGSVNFDVYVGISRNYVTDASNTTVYLLSDYQRIKVVFRGTPNDISAVREEFVGFLSNFTGTIVGINAIRAHKTDSAISDPKQTDMFLFAVDPSFHQVIDAFTFKNLIDKVYVDQRSIFDQYNVTEVMPLTTVELQPSIGGTERSLIIAFAIVGVFLLLLLCLLCIIGFFCQKKYKRKIKAANAIAAVSNGSNTDFNALTTPGTNAYNLEGSNPVWHENFGGQFYNLSDTDRNSCDENTRQASSGSQEEFFDSSETNKTNHNSKKMHFYKVNGFGASRSDSYKSDRTVVSNQNHPRRLVPEKKKELADKVTASSTAFVAHSTNV